MIVEGKESIVVCCISVTREDILVRQQIYMKRIGANKLNIFVEL